MPFTQPIRNRSIPIEKLTRNAGTQVQSTLREEVQSANAVGAHVYCNAVVVTNVSLSGPITIDGVSYSNEETILVAGQTNNTQNGVYTVNASGAWQRISEQIFEGDILYVAGTSMFASTLWLCTAYSGSIAFRVLNMRGIKLQSGTTTNYNNYDWRGYSHVRFGHEAGSLVQVTGFTAGVDGQILNVYSKTPLQFLHDSFSSSAGNRIDTVNGKSPVGDYDSTGTGIAAQFMYDATRMVWVLIALRSRALTWTLTSAQISTTAPSTYSQAFENSMRTQINNHTTEISALKLLLQRSGLVV